MSQESPINPTCLISWKHFFQFDTLSALVNTDFLPCRPFTLLPLSIRSKIKTLISGSVVCGLYKTRCKHAFRHPLQFCLTALLFFSCIDSAQITTKLARVAATGQHNALPFITEKCVVHSDVALRSVTLISHASTQEQSFTKFIYYSTCLG